MIVYVFIVAVLDDDDDKLMCPTILLHLVGDYNLKLLFVNVASEKLNAY